MNIENFINSKNDIYNLKTKWPDKILKYLKNEYEKAFKWQETKTLNKKSDGIEDFFHKVDKKNEKYIQFEKIIDINAPIFEKIGFTPNELKEVIKKLELNIL